MIIKNLKKYFTFEVQVQTQDQDMLHGLVRIYILCDSCFSFTPITSRCWMIKMFAGDFERVTIRARRGWSPSSAQCQCGWMTDGTRFSSTCRTSPGGLTEPTISRRCVYRSVPLQVKKVFYLKNSDPFFIFRSMQTVEYGECISPTDSTRRMSYQQSLSSICLSRTKKLRCRHTPTTFCLLNIYNIWSDICLPVFLFSQQ